MMKKKLQSNHFFLSEPQELIIFNIFIIAIVANYPIHLQRKIGK